MPERREIKRIGGKIAEQASRFKPCPPKLAELIELVNLIPPECELPDYDEVTEKLFSAANIKMILGEFARRLADEETNAADYDRTEVRAAALEICLKDLPESFQEYVRMDWLGVFEPTWQAKVIEALQSFDRPAPPLPRPIDRETRISIAVDRYVIFRIYRESLKRIARFVRRKNLSNEPLTTIALSAHIGVDEQDDLIFQYDKLGEALAELAKTDIKNKATRIRECEACQRIFWAGRITMKGCSARCGDLIRKRRYRERQNEYEYRRYKREEDANKSRMAKAVRQQERKVK